MYCIIITTTDDQSIACNISNLLVKEKLSNCVQISDITSVFEWEGEIKNTREYKLTIKTNSNKYPKIEALILKTHNSKLPEIIKVDISGGSEQYLNWLIS